MHPFELPGLAAQETRLLRIDVPRPTGQLVVERMSGNEAVNDLFRFDIDCLATCVGFDAAALLGEGVALRLLLPNGELRHWHGHCTGIASLAANGEAVRYRLTLEPWLAFLAQGRNSRVFQSMDVRGICDEVFSRYQPHSQWRFEVAQPLRRRSLCIQHRESDLHFLLRLFAEEGLSYRFEHRKSVESGNTRERVLHELVIFDRAAIPPTATPERIRFHRADATEEDDSIQTLADTREVVPGRVSRGSWNYRTLVANLGESARVRNEGGVLAEDHDCTGTGRDEDRPDAELRAGLALSAHASRQRRLRGEGTVRSMEAGTQFALEGHWTLGNEGENLAVLRVEHCAANNLGSGVPERWRSSDIENGTYRNRFELQPATAPFMPAARRKPIARPETAIVTGEAGGGTGPDRDHRITVKFHWQRDGDSRSPGSRAPEEPRGGVRVRVSEWLSGANWGSHFLPYDGMEVLVDFLDGDIDQPIIVGQLYNGRDLPPFSAGHASGANHAGVISGWMGNRSARYSQEFNQWIVDDSPGQLRTRLATSYAASELSLGHIVGQSGRDAKRGGWRGAGFELRTDGWLALRAAEGLLITSTPRAGAVGAQLEVPEAVARLREAERTAGNLSHRATAADARPLRANALQTTFTEAIGIRGKRGQGVEGAGRSPPYRFERGATRDLTGPAILVEGPDDIGFSTPAGNLLFAAGCLHATAQADLHTAAANTFSATAGTDASWFAGTGFEAIAASGSGSIHALSGRLEILVDSSATVTSSADEVHIIAGERVVLQAGQSSITLAGQDITFACPGVFSVKGAGHAFEGPARHVAAGQGPASAPEP